MGLISCSESKSSYIISDISINEDISSNKRERYLKSALGSEIDLEFYDTKVKVIIKENNEEKKVYILDKVNDKQYKYTDSRKIFIHDSRFPNDSNIGYHAMQYFDMILDMDNLLGFYTTNLTLSMYEDGKLIRLVKAKRKGL